MSGHPGSAGRAAAGGHRRGDHRGHRRHAVHSPRAQGATASWFHDASARGDRKVGCGNNWVIEAVAVRLALLDRPVALPVAFALIRKDSPDASRLDASRRLVDALAAGAGPAPKATNSPASPPWPHRPPSPQPR